MRLTSVKHGIRLSSKLFLANALTNSAFMLIVVIIILSFINVSRESSGIANESIEHVVRNADLTRELSQIFFDIDLMDRTFDLGGELLASEGGRLQNLIESVRRDAVAPELKKSLASLLVKFEQYFLQGVLVNDALQARELIDKKVHMQLTNLEEVITEWLIKTTLAGESTDFVMQQLALVNGYRESWLEIGRLYGVLDLHTGMGEFSSGVSSINEAIDNLALRLQTITASTQEIAWKGEGLKESVLEYKAILKRLSKTMEQLDLLRGGLVASRADTLAVMESIDEEIATSTQEIVGRIREIVIWSGAFAILATLGIIFLTYFITRHLIKSNIHQPMQGILESIDSFSRGRLEKRIELGRIDEWDLIGRSLNSMAMDLESSRKALQRSYEELEQKVKDRTQELANTVEALSESESSLVEAQQIAHLGHWAWDIQSGENVWSAELYRIFGIEPFALNVNHELFLSFLHSGDLHRFQKVLSDAVRHREPFKKQFRIVRRDGSIRWVEAQGQVGSSQEGEPTEISGTVLDITELKRVEQLLLEEKERALVTLHSIGDAVITTDPAGCVQYLNPVAEDLTGYSVNESVGQSLERIFHIVNEETRERAADPALRCLKEGKIIGLANHTVLVSKSGIEYSIQDSAAPIKNQEGKILGVVLVFSDVTEARRLSLQVSYQASHDILTGLINRREFEQRLNRVIETARNLSTHNALCYLDLDQFKLVNDTCGHVAGDELLRQVSMLLQENVRYRDTVARLGGDEFGLLMEHCSIKEAKQVASKLIAAISAFNFFWERQLFRIGVSIGLVAVNEYGADINSLLSAADTACYIAKDQGRNRIHVYEEDDSELAKRHGEMQWAARIPRALDANSFQLYVQPIIPILGDSKEGSHYEVLLRMKDDQVVLPKVFLPAADRYNLSSKLDRWVVTNTFNWIADHPEHLEGLYLCSINLSGHSLNEERFLGFILQQLKDFAIPPQKICFEITETVAITNLSRTSTFIEGLKTRGCRFSLDDFGSGLSSFAYLKNLPVDFLKIDGVFVKDIVDDSLDLAMVKSINEIGHVMGKKTIAEFVENDIILDKLRGIGVDYVQGYKFGWPRPIGDI